LTAEKGERKKIAAVKGCFVLNLIPFCSRGLESGAFLLSGHGKYNTPRVSHKGTRGVKLLLPLSQKWA
jgi:hypothetical protein